MPVLPEWMRKVVEDSLSGRVHTNDRENERRRRQLKEGKLTEHPSVKKLTEKMGLK